jgi:hypothetical protein
MPRDSSKYSIAVQIKLGVAILTASWRWWRPLLGSAGGWEVDSFMVGPGTSSICNGTVGIAPLAATFARINFKASVSPHWPLASNTPISRTVPSLHSIPKHSSVS